MVDFKLPVWFAFLPAADALMVAKIEGRSVCFLFGNESEAGRYAAMQPDTGLMKVETYEQLNNQLLNKIPPNVTHIAVDPFTNTGAPMTVAEFRKAVLSD